MVRGRGEQPMWQGFVSKKQQQLSNDVFASAGFQQRWNLS